MRRKIDVPRAAQLWFLGWAEHVRRRHGFSLYRALTQAQAWAPEVFGRVHADTPRKWKPAGAMSEPIPGRPCRLSAEIVQILGVEEHDSVESAFGHLLHATFQRASAAGNIKKLCA